MAGDGIVGLLGTGSDSSSLTQPGGAHPYLTSAVTSSRMRSDTAVFTDPEPTDFDGAVYRSEIREENDGGAGPTCLSFGNE
jgi:hypothetical protein